MPAQIPKIIQCLGFGINLECEGLVSEETGVKGILHTVVKSTNAEIKKWDVDGYICKHCLIAAGYEVVVAKDETPAFTGD